MQITRSNMLEEVDLLQEDLVKFVTQLVAIPTVNPPGENYVECAKVIANRLQKIGFKVDLIDVPEERLSESQKGYPRVCVLASLGDGKPILHINGHYDVVPPGTGWSVDPFSGLVKDGKIYGRGSSDMKGGIVSLMGAVEALIRAGAKIKGKIVFAAVPDEEIGGRTGTGYLKELGLLNGDMAIIGEGGAVDKVSIGHKGALWLKIVTRGSSAHGSSPHLGVNAVTKMMHILTGLEKLGADLTNRRMPSSAYCSLAPSPTLMAGGVIKGGSKVNVVPDVCEVTVDRRLMPEESPEKAEHEIRDLIYSMKKEDPELQADLEVISIIPPVLTSESSQLVKTMYDAVRYVNNIDPKIILTSGFTDMHFYATDMPTVAYSPSMQKLAHSSNEHILIDHLVRATKAQALAVMDLIC